MAFTAIEKSKESKSFGQQMPCCVSTNRITHHSNIHTRSTRVCTLIMRAFRNYVTHSFKLLISFANNETKTEMHNDEKKKQHFIIWWAFSKNYRLIEDSVKKIIIDSQKHPYLDQTTIINA